MAITVRTHNIVPYSDGCQFFAGGNYAVPTWTSYAGKGWQKAYVGEHVASYRKGDPRRTMLSRFHPGFSYINVFSDISYHSPINKGKANKVDRYGTDPNMVGYSTYSLVDTYTLLYPVLSNRSRDFGKLLNRVRTFIWTYTVVNWIPGDPITWQVQRTEHYPDGTRRVLYQSPVYLDPRQARSEFDKLIKKGK